ncbi:hypothetical protein EKL97_01820 [Flavobacterium sp. LS1P28]|uniref:Uncharacterized protein n=1 Tax=Flavobacterium bomense TaxID=2497483 RepID=A0A3S0QA49_9FLAO|nr:MULTISPECIES: hypothetical protein [Flavobacterium]RTY81931.1 hypothetical protein EKL99_11385 [Flavobacterium sp. ZB4P23]RTY85377.1 hypothetical protein EKL97_01820 [Flavobacterium sp. LS1P28]RTY88151.1 hypothetical protein EKM00_03100 [Flavobacterium sp. RSP15]RTZ07879.1 hypothetical protein EKL98_00760 [Flavobacterium bomense]RTZ09020.1 hypothetical protein EKM03_00050 [Flavobacterium sp. GSP6]
MKTENKVSKFFIHLGIILLTVGFLSIDLDDFSFENNKKSYFKIIVAIVSFMISFYRIQNEKHTNQIKN